MEKKKETNYIIRVWVLMVLVGLASVGLYYLLPNQILGFELRKMDLLSDLRPHSADADSTDRAIQAELASLSHPTNTPKKTSDTTSVASTNIYDQIQQEANQDSIQTLIQDFTPGHQALTRFFSKLANRSQLGRPVRIAVLGDSFIEGDIFVSAIRSGLQKRYGGSGVGWIAMHSSVAGFRHSIHHQDKGWTEYSLLDKSPRGQTITGYYHSPTAGATTTYQLNKGERPIASAVLYYQSPSPLAISVETSGRERTLELGATEASNIGKAELLDSLASQLTLRILSPSDGVRIYGVGLEGKAGISVDNFSLRGNSGMLISSVNEGVNTAFLRERSYDLIILQYGLNVANSKVTNYDYYAKSMRKVLGLLRKESPESDILLLSVSDRSERFPDGQMGTMRGIAQLHKTQRELAEEFGCGFYSLLGAMRGLGGMTNFVSRSWASKDYTHLTHQGGQQLGKLFVEALDIEQKYYDATH